MRDVQAEPGLLQIIFHNDNETPQEFVVDLLHSVFKKSAADTTRLLEKIDITARRLAGPIRASVPTSCLQRPDDASGLPDIRS